MAVINVGPSRAFTTVMAAYVVATDGDVLLLDEAIYEETITFEAKWVHLIGNTRSPGTGKVVIQLLQTVEPLLYFNNILSSPTIYVEGIDFKWTPGSLANVNYDSPIIFKASYGTIVVFNRCVFDASSYWYFIFNSGGNGISRLNLYNCRFNYQINNEWSTAGCDNQFEKNNSVVMVDIQKCILPFMLEQAGRISPIFPNGMQHNVANIDNTTSDLLNIANVFKVESATYAYKNSTVIGQEYYIYTDLGSAKFITYFGIRGYYNASNMAGKIELMGSNDELVWSSLYIWQDADTTLKLVLLYPTTAFRYYKVGITAQVTEAVRIANYFLLEAGNDNIFFDYVEPPGKVGYGPAYGEFLYTLPPRYYFSGTINDALIGSSFVDSVTFNPYDKAAFISLSDGDHKAHLSYNYSYTDCGVRATVSRNTGKWYWEYLIVASKYSLCRLGVGTSDASLYTALGSDAFGFGYEEKTGCVYNKGVIVAETGQMVTVGDTVGIAYDAYNGRLWFSVNGVWLLSGDPVSGVNPTVEINADLFPMVSLNSSSLVGSEVVFVTSESALVHPIPEGFRYYGISSVWRIKATNADTNCFMSETYSDNKDNSYTLFTTYSGAHFLICEDFEDLLNYNDLILGKMIPEVW